MVYDGSRPGNGVWHCPFPPEWVERMRRAVKHCTPMTAEQIAAGMVGEYCLPPGDFLSEEQDARGLPLSWCREYDERHKGWPECCTAIYDYDSIPETVVTNGEDDRPIVIHERVLTA